MSKIMYTVLLLAAMACSVTSIGCQTPGGNGYSGSDGHAGHSH